MAIVSHLTTYSIFLLKIRKERKAEKRKEGKRKKMYWWSPACTTCPQIDLDLQGEIVLEFQKKMHVAQAQTMPLVLLNYHSSSPDSH